MRFYGGLRRHIPLTFWAMTAGTLAITGVGVIGVFGLAGFYSKDAIIAAAFAAGGQAGYAAVVVGLFGVGRGAWGGRGCRKGMNRGVAVTSKKKKKKERNK